MNNDILHELQEIIHSAKPISNLFLKRIVKLLESQQKEILELRRQNSKEINTLESMENFVKSLDTREKCLEFTVKTGIVDKNGKLTEHYK